MVHCQHLFWQLGFQNTITSIKKGRRELKFKLASIGFPKNNKRITRPFRAKKEVYCSVFKINDVMNNRVVSRQSPLCLKSFFFSFSFHASQEHVSLFPRSSVRLRLFLIGLAAPTLEPHQHKGLRQHLLSNDGRTADQPPLSFTSHCT